MDATLPFIHIKTAKFPVLPGEDDELVNEGTYGKALALYLEERLKEKSHRVPFICCEDWGWWVEIEGHPFTTGVRIYATENLAESHELCVAVAPDPGQRWSWSRFRFVDTTKVAKKLFADLNQIFTSDPEVETLGHTQEYPLD